MNFITLGRTDKGGASVVVHWIGSELCNRDASCVGMTGPPLRWRRLASEPLVNFSTCQPINISTGKASQPRCLLSSTGQTHPSEERISFRATRQLINLSTHQHVNISTYQLIHLSTRQHFAACRSGGFRRTKLSTYHKS